MCPVLPCTCPSSLYRVSVATWVCSQWAIALALARTGSHWARTGSHCTQCEPVRASASQCEPSASPVRAQCEPLPVHTSLPNTLPLPLSDLSSAHLQIAAAMTAGDAATAATASAAAEPDPLDAERPVLRPTLPPLPAADSATAAASAAAGLLSASSSSAGLLSALSSSAGMPPSAAGADAASTSGPAAAAPAATPAAYQDVILVDHRGAGARLWDHPERGTVNAADA